MSWPQHPLPTGSSRGTGGGPFPGARAPRLLHPPFSRTAQFSRAPSAAQASGFQRQRCYLKPLLFASLTPAATSCCRSMRAHPGPASQRKAANDEQVQRRLFFVLITKRLPKQSPSAPRRAVIYSSPSPGHAGSFLQTAMPWDPFNGPQGWRPSHRPGSCSQRCPIPARSLAGAATRAAGSARARERVGAPPAPAPCSAQAAGGPGGASSSGQHRSLSPLPPRRQAHICHRCSPLRRGHGAAQLQDAAEGCVPQPSPPRPPDGSGHLLRPRARRCSLR